MTTKRLTEPALQRDPLLAPAVHGPGLVDRLLPQVMGIDAMVVHLGGTQILGILLTMDGRQDADLVQLIEPRTTVPVHTDDYTVFRSPLSDFRAAVAHRDLRSEIRPVARGQRITLLGAAHQPSRSIPDR